MFLIEEARRCRSLAVAFEGRAEGSFLLKAAEAFEELASCGAPLHSAPEALDAVRKPASGFRTVGSAPRCV